MLLITKFIAVLDVKAKGNLCKDKCTPEAGIFYEVIDALEPGDTEILKHDNCVLSDGACAMIEALNEKTAVAADKATIEFEEMEVDRMGSLKLTFILYNANKEGKTYLA